MMPDAVQRLANVLGATALAVNDRLGAEVGALKTPADHPSAAATLALLDWVPAMPQGRLAFCLGLSQPATVRLIDRLQAAGLVRRIRRQRRRQLWIEITDAGREIARHFGSQRQQALREIVEQLSSTEQDLLARLLNRLSSSFLKAREQVMRVCRLCDARACGTDDDCPMWRAARVLP